MELSFVTEPENLKDYICSVCDKVLLEPHVTECCGKHFCEQCLEKRFRDQGKEICPNSVCQRTNFRHIRYLRFKVIIGEFLVYCPDKIHGCAATICVKELEDHKNICLYSEVDCFLQCGQRKLRKDLEDHTTNHCPKRSTICMYCHEKGEYEFIVNAVHQEKCPDYPVGCARKCSDGDLVKRRDLDKHTSLCPLEPQTCSDCKKELIRKEMDDHKNKFCQKRKIECKECGKADAYDQITGSHVSECPERLVACPRKCEGSKQMKRKDMKDHAKVCPLEPVLCPFDNVGCKPGLMRKDLNDHLDSNMQQHQLKLMKAQSEMRENLCIMTSSILYELKSLESPDTKSEEKTTSLQCIRAVLNPKITNKTDKLIFHIPSIEHKWFSIPFYVLKRYKMRLIFESCNQGGTDHQALATSTSDGTTPTVVSFHLMMGENIEEFQSTLFIDCKVKPYKSLVQDQKSRKSSVGAESTGPKPLLIELPLREITSNVDHIGCSGTKELVKKSTVLQGPQICEVYLSQKCPHCHYSLEDDYARNLKCFYCKRNL